MKNEAKDIFTQLHKDIVVKCYMEKFKKYNPQIYFHSINVAYQSLNICHQLGYSYIECKEITKGALLHDVGKLSIPNDILRKKGRLTAEEYNIIKTHPRKGLEYIIKEFPNDLLSNIVLDIIGKHHERIDGNGYPNKIKADQISEYVRIVITCDVYSAMTENRIYAAKRSHRDAVEEMLQIPCYEKKYIYMLDNSICPAFE